ncbi:hypothetical protein RSJ42_01770 [Methanosarcina hadiensis]|uniref:hypothetical protein n=1 Tax=Methanosarcina hadiensis TaxID=3078083 RepID=UPI003977771B
MAEDPVRYGAELNTEKLNKLKEKLDAYENELKRFRAEVEDLEAQQKSLIEEKKKIIKCEICGKFYVLGDIHECQDIED